MEVLRLGMKHADVISLKKIMNELGYNLAVTDKFDSATEEAVRAFQEANRLLADGVVGNKETWPKLLDAVSKPGVVIVKPPAWYLYAKTFQGKNEADPAFNKFMTSKWSLFGLKLKSIIGSANAWCGLFLGVALAGTGFAIQKNGAGAKNWGSYAQEIDWRKVGIRQGALIQQNHVKCGSGSNNHVTMADGDCSPADLLKKNATFNGYGGNQGNKAKVSTFPVSEICSVRWPDEQAYPGPVSISKNCSGSTSTGDSTR